MTPLETALEYIRRGWAVVPIPSKHKRPVEDEWQHLRITERTAPQWFNGEAQNVGVQLGELSGGLADADLDTAEAIDAAGYFLPPTLCFGRTSKPRSHWLYQSDLWQTEDKSTIQFNFATGKGKDRTEKMILELRTGGGSKGAQTVFPGSVHPSGELIAWDDPRETIATVEGASLKQSCARAASAALLAAHFPSKGARHDAGLTLGGFLSRCGFNRPDAELFAEAVTIASGQPMEKVKDVRKAAREAWDEGKREGGRARGFPALAETFGDDVAKHVAKWLGYEGGHDATHPGGEGASGKVRFAAIPPDAEAGPVMKLLDDVLSGVNVAEPPMRDVEGWPVEIQCRETAGLHELSSGGANDGDDEKSRLPPPKNFLLTKHDKESLEILIGDLITFMQKGKKGGERPVAPPAKFVNHYLKYRRSRLPRVHAALTMPLVLPTGTLLACNGLDRKRRAVFRIDPGLLRFVPKAEDCTEIAVEEAFGFLTDEWLCDVATDLEGKCVLIALAMTIIERVLLPARPLFFVTAGLRGGGKTTALMLVSIAATGIKAAAAAWASDPNERKKALFSYLLEALPFLVWDNIPRGTMIACPHLERASTAETYSDRVLGETKTLIAPAYTIHAFTGNNIGPKSDQASRSLEARLSTDKPDPENREFKHQDPVGWTQDHRGQILGALYTILLGNPQLKRPRASETRFKEWWHLVGSAVEHAADHRAEKLMQPISFKQMFDRTEAKDEEAAERADIIQTLYAIYGGTEFTALGLEGHLAKSARDSEIGAGEEKGTTELRRFCTAKLAKAPSQRSVSHNLQAVTDAPVKVLAGIAVLKTYVDTHTKQRRFSVKVSG